MSADPNFRCPVCRAAQTLRETCRRCQADLRLVARAHRRLAYLKDQQARTPDSDTPDSDTPDSDTPDSDTLACDDEARQRQRAAELRWLAPSR